MRARRADEKTLDLGVGVRPGINQVYETLATKAGARKGRARSSPISPLRLRRYAVPPTTTETEGCLVRTKSMIEELSKKILTNKRTDSESLPNQRYGRRDSVQVHTYRCILGLLKRSRGRMEDTGRKHTHDESVVLG